MAEETNGMGFLDYKGDDKTNVPMKPQEPEVVKSVPSPKPASVEKPTTVSQVNEKLTKEALAAPTPTTKSVKEKALVGGPLKTPVVGEVERKERTWDYDFGDNKTGKNPYEAKKSTVSDEFGVQTPSMKEVLAPDYKPLDQESFNNLAEWIVKRQGANFDNLYSDPAKYAKYVDESVRRAKTKEGYYLTDQHRKDLADRALTIASQYNYQRKVLPDAIKKSGVAQKMLDRGYNPYQDTDKEISGLISKGEKKAKEQGQILFDQVKSKHQKEIDQIKSDADSIFKEAQSRQQELLNTMVQPLYNSKVAEIQSMLDQNKISFEEAKAYVDGDGEGPSPMQVEIGNQVMQSPEFKKQASDISSQYLKPINDRLYQINQTIKSDFDQAWGPQGEKINSEIEKEAALIQSKSGMTKEESDILMKAIGGVMDDHDNIEYARSYAIRAMSYGPGGSAVVGKSFLKGISSVTDDMIASMFNTFSDTYVNKMNVEISKKQFENNWINTSSLVEKEGWTGGINPASVATYVGQQVPIMAMTAGVGLATGAASAIAAEAIGATVNASRLIGATAGGVADWVASTELNNEGVRKQAIAQGLSPEQADKTVYENTKNMSLLMPLYMLQMGTLLSPSLKITQKFGFEMGLETVQEHLENMASNVAVAKGEGSYGKIDPMTGEKMGLSYQTMKYLYDPEFKETTLATLFSTAILGGAMSNIGSNVNSKLEKAAMFKMFQGDGHISSKAALDIALDMGKITEEQHVEGTRKIEALRRSIESSHKMDLGDTNLTIAAAYKMYDIANNEAAMAVETNEATKSVLKEKIDTANKELKEIASGKSPVYVLYTANSGPVVLTKEDIASKADDHEFVKALHDKTQALEVINDPATKSKINESIKSYAEARAKNVEKMSSTAEENRMTKEEALELVDLQTKEEQLAKTGQELTDIEKQRMSELSSKGTINLAAIERGAKRKESLEGTTRDFANRVRKSLSKSFKNTTIVDSSENPDEFVNGIVSELKAAKGTENVSFDKQSGNFVIGQPDGQTEVIPFENIKGLRIGDKVYYNSFSATKDTMVHEVAAHGWINEALKATTIQGMEGDVTMDDILNADDNSLNETGKLLKQGLNLMKDSDYHQELYGNSFYSSNSLGSILEEALAQAIGEHGAKFQESKIQQLKQWIMKFIPFLRQNKGKFIEGAPSADMSIKDYLDGVVSDVFGDSELGTALSEERAMSDAINDRFENNETAFEDDGTPLKRNFSVSGSDIVEPKKSKYKEVKVSRLGHNLSFVKKSDVIDIVSLIKQIRSEKKKVWFWVADQLGRGYYYDEVIDGMHYLDAGPSYPLDPVNRKNGIIWASGLEEQTILNNIANSDYIFIISGSPERSKMFNQQVYDLFIKRAGDYAEFKKNILATSGISMLNKIVSKYNSWEELRSDRIETKKNKKGKPVYEPVRKVFLSIINDQKSKQRTALKKMLVEKNLFIDFDSLRDGFYRDNGFDINDIMLVLKPESIVGKSKHSTYETDLSGSVVGVPDKIINAYDIISDEYKKKNKGILQRVNQSQVIAPFGSGIRSIGRKFQVHTQDGFAAKPAGKVFTTPHYNASIMVADYVRAKGLPPVKQAIVKALDVNLSSAIADYYDTVQNDPNNPEVIAAYQQMADETRDQFDHMISNGYSIEIYNGEGEPYKVAADMIKDLNENKHLYILSTKKEYGQGEYDQNDPLLKPSGRYDINGEELLNNDLFRAVHDFYGHAVMGNGFGPVGEENAWLIHSQMYSDKARGVMTTETRMQNSWVNFNRFLRTVSTVKEEEDRVMTAAALDSVDSDVIKNEVMPHVIDPIDDTEEGIRDNQSTLEWLKKKMEAYFNDDIDLSDEEFFQIKKDIESISAEIEMAEKALFKYKNNYHISSEYYHAKVNGTNPELVNAVDKVLREGLRPAKLGEEGYVPLSERRFAEQKKTIAPDWIVSSGSYISQQPIVGDNHVAKFSVKDKDFPKDKNVNAIVNSRIYGQLTEDGEGNFVFFHASPNAKLDKLGVDPAKFGYNLRTSGEERRRSVPVSMYYTRADVSDVIYKSKYFVKIPKNKVYFFNADPLGLKEKAMAAFMKNNKKTGYDLAYNANEQIGYMMLEAKKLGYKMIIAKWGNGLLRAETVDKIYPTKLLDLEGNVIKPITRVNFLSNAQKKRGYRVPKDNRLASERDYKWYDAHVDDLLASELTKDEFISKMQTGKFVILTPENPNNQDYFEYENDNLVSDFEDEMTRMEINFTPVIGKYGRYERSFIIFDTEKSKAKSLCKKFMQESVAADFGIYYLEGDKFNPRLFSEDKFMDGQMDDGDDFMSTIMTTDGPVSFSLGYDFSKDKPFKSKFQIIGIEGAKKVKSMRGGFVNANKMEMENYAPKYIFAATGWFRDFAGNWAYEIDNGDIKNMPNENPMLLSDVLDYDEVFKMYPDAGDFKVIMKELPDQSTAQVNLSTKEITLNANTFAGGKNEELLKQSLMHELQHVIQMKEGFDMGSSLESSIGVLEWVRGAITKFNDAIAENRVKISDTNFERYMNRIKVDVKSVEAISEIMKQEQRQEVIPYFFDYGEMVARYSEGIVKSKSDKTPMFSILPTEHLFALSSKRIINIHDAFIKGTGKISHGPGKKLNIPTFGWQVDGENIRKAIQNERLARGTTMKAAANYFSGVTETPEEKEARLQLRDQIMLEIMAAKDAYEQAQVEAALAREYEGKKRDIEEAFRLQEAEDRITKRLNRKIRYEQVVSAFRLLGERQEFEAKIATWEGTKSMIITIIEDYRKRGAFLGKINARTLSTFSKMILNANTDKRLNTALAYLDKALEDKRYDELVAAIRSRKDMIASMIKNDKNPFGNMYDSVVELISYDESKLFDANAINNFEGMEVYLNMLDSIANKNMPDFKAYTSEYYIIKDMMERAIDNDITDAVFDEIKTYDQMNAAIDNITSMEINSAEDFIVFRKLAYTLNRKVEDLFMNGFISQEQYDETTIALSRKSRSEKIEQPEIRQKVEEFEAMEFDAAKRMINNIDTSTLSGFNLKYFNKLKLMVNKPSALSDFRKIGTDGIILLSKIADQLGVGFVSPKMFKIISDVNVQVSADTMAADVSNAVAESLKPGFMKRRIPDDVMKIISKIQGLPKQVVDQALSLGKSKTYYNNIVYELNKAFTNIRIKNKELGSMMNTKMRKYLVGPSWVSSMPEIERYRVGLLMKQLDYQSNIVDFEASDRPKDVTRHLLSDDFQRALLSDPNEYAAIKKAYESFPKKENGDIDVEEAIKKLSGREKALFDAIRNLFDEHLHPMMQETNARRGELVENQNNYYRRYSQGIKQSSFDEDMTPASIVSNMETYRIRSGSTKSRISDGLYWTVVDPEAVVFRAINEMSTDYYLSEAVPNAMSTLKYANSRVDGKAKYIITALQQLTRNTLVTELTVNRDAYTFDIFSYANSTARNLLLSSPTRFFTEMIPSLAKGFISQANTDNFEVAFEKFKKKEGHLYKKLYYDMSLPFKDNIGRYSLEGGSSGRESVLAASADAVSTMSDALFSKFVFKTEFETEFFRVVGQEFDIKKYNEDAVYAQNLLDSGVMDQVAKVAMYNTERIAGPLSQFSVPTKMLWVDRTSKIAKILGFMQSYNAFEQKMFINNIRDAISGENEGILKATRMSAGIIAGGMSYAMIGYFINQLYKEMGGDDEEDMSEEVKQAWQSTVDKQSAMNMFIKSCINTLTGAYGQLSSIGANFLAGIIDTMIKKGHKLDKQDQEKYKKIKDAINEWFYFKPIDFSSYSRTSLEDGLSVMTLFGLYVTPASDMLVDAYTIYAKKKRNEELTDEEKLWDNIMVGAHAIANFAGLQYPGMAMVHKLLKSEARKDGEKIKKEVNSKKDLEKAIKTMTGSRYQRRPTKAEKEESEIQDIIPEGLQKYE